MAIEQDDRCVDKKYLENNGKHIKIHCQPIEINAGENSIKILSVGIAKVWLKSESVHGYRNNEERSKFIVIIERI